MNRMPPILLIAHETAGTTSLADRAMMRVGDAVRALGYETVRAASAEDGLALVESRPVFGAVALDWDLPGGEQFPQGAAVEIVRAIRARSRLMPILLVVERTLVSQIPLEVTREVREYIHLLSETPQSTANRLDFAVKQYYGGLLPSYFRALKQQVDEGIYMWDAPGHQGGEAYRRHPVGAEFYRLFGDGMLRADLGISVPDLGDWLEHLGVPGESERRAARAFGADWTFYVVVGTSGSNRIVVNGVVAQDEIVLADRNCHKSLNHAFTLSGARPTYLMPSRNGYGMIGVIPPSRITPAHVKKLVETSPLAKGAASNEPAYAVITNSTYDGLCYDVARVVKTLGPVVPRLHFDEAWYGYAHFHPMYQNRYAMGVKSDDAQRPLLFATHSTHKMLPALSMSSMIHVKRSPRVTLDFHVFNQSFMMHGTTSPFYPIIASNDVATAMMEPPAGRTLLDEAIRDAIGFRQAVASAKRQLAKADTDPWFFDVFQPERVTDPKGGKQYAFADAPVELLATEPACWVLKPKEAWHGFSADEIEGGYCLLDPVKVTITCPGIDAQGKLSDQGIPGSILTRFLDERRTYIARTGDYTLLVLFSIGSSQGKWGTLLEALHEFKRLYDGGATVREALPKLSANQPRYADLTLRALCDAIHAKMRELDMPRLSQEAVSADPQPVLAPAAAYQKLIRNEAELVPISECANRISGVMLVPYPPGIPVLMPGERMGPRDSAGLRYLVALEAFDRAFPGFEHEVHGIEHDENRNLYLRALVEEHGREPKAAPALAPHELAPASKRARA
jgi:arginine decarboxylase